MKASMEISMYPLSEKYESPILDFIARLNGYEGLVVRKKYHEYAGVWRL